LHAVTVPLPSFEALLASLQEARCNENKAVTALLEKRGGLVHPDPKLDTLVSVRFDILHILHLLVAMLVQPPNSEG
jgi:hypothetical protein